jgi:hypothetical protein
VGATSIIVMLASIAALTVATASDRSTAPHTFPIPPPPSVSALTLPSLPKSLCRMASGSRATEIDPNNESRRCTSSPNERRRGAATLTALAARRRILRVYRPSSDRPAVPSIICPYCGSDVDPTTFDRHAAVCPGRGRGAPSSRLSPAFQQKLFSSIRPVEVADSVARAAAHSWDPRAELVKIDASSGEVMQADSGFIYQRITGWSYHYRAPGKYLVLQHSDDERVLERTVDAPAFPQLGDFEVLDPSRLIDLTEAEKTAFRSGYSDDFFIGPTLSLSVLLYSIGTGPVWVFVNSGGGRFEVPAVARGHNRRDGTFTPPALRDARVAPRRDRVARERQAREAARRKRLFGFGATAVVAIAAIALLLFLAGDRSKPAGDGAGATGPLNATDWLPLAAATRTYAVEVGATRPLYATQTAWPVPGGQLVQTTRGVLNLETRERGVLALRLEPVDVGSVGALPPTAAARTVARLHVERDDLGIYASLTGTGPLDAPAGGLEDEPSIFWIAYAIEGRRDADAVAEVAFVPRTASTPSDALGDGVMGRVLVAFDPTRAHRAFLPEDLQEEWEVRSGATDRCRDDATCMTLVRSVTAGAKAAQQEVDRAFVERFWFERDAGLVEYEQTIDGELAMRWMLRATSPTS